MKMIGLNESLFYYQVDLTPISSLKSLRKIIKYILDTELEIDQDDETAAEKFYF